MGSRKPSYSGFSPGGSPRASYALALPPISFGSIGGCTVFISSMNELTPDKFPHVDKIAIFSGRGSEDLGEYLARKLVEKKRTLASWKRNGLFPNVIRKVVRTIRYDPDESMIANCVRLAMSRDVTKRKPHCWI